MDVLTCRLPIPPLRIFQVCRCSNTHLCEVAHGIFSLGQSGLGSLSCPKISLRVTLLEDAFGAREVPSAKGKLALVLLLHGGFAIPCDALPRIDITSEETVLVRTAQSELREFVAESRSLSEITTRRRFVVLHAIDCHRLFMK